MSHRSIEPSAPRAPFRAVLAACLLGAALAGCGGGGGAGVGQTEGVAPAIPQRQMGALQGTAALDERQVQIREVAQAVADRAIPRVIALPALPETRSEALPVAGPGQPQQIGFSRSVVLAADAGATAQLLDWTTAADGSRRAAIDVRSPDARGVRLGLRVQQLPPGTVLRVYGPGAQQMLEISGTEVLRSIQRNLDGGATGDDAYTYWLPSVDGAEAVLEAELAPGVNPALFKVALPRVVHLKVLPGDALETPQAAGACNVDVMCTAAQDTQSRSVARMSFVDGLYAYACTGTLLNNTKVDYTPYLLSANHCISRQSVASSLETYWNYRSSSCNSQTQAGDMQRVSGGAQLLWNSSGTDTSLMRLNGSPPSGAIFAGWNAEAPVTPGASVFSVHHPDGGWQKYSAGTMPGYAACTGTYCLDAPVGSASHLIVTWSRGVTEPGSSGGALFSSSGKVIGQLSGGTSSCSNPGGEDFYGRLDLAYANGLYQWLSPTGAATGTRSPVYRFYNSVTAAHFYTNNQLERDYVIANYPTYSYEGAAYYAYNSATPGTSAVYRFYNTRTRVHFYTINPAERDYVIATLPDFHYEGPTWYAQTGAGNDASPLYRFYSSLRGAHFYTLSASERDYVIATLPDFNYEGIGFYTWAQP